MQFHEEIFQNHEKLVLVNICIFTILAFKQIKNIH